MTALRSLEALRTEMAGPLAALDERLADAGPGDATILSIPRPGYAVTRLHVESLLANSDGDRRILCVDVEAPPAARHYLQAVEKETPGFFHLPIDALCSRQTARLLALELVRSPFVAFIDNNMEVSPGWLGRLLAAADETGAALVSPVLVTRGGDIHFSAGRIERRPEGIVRPHHQPGARTRTRLADAAVRRVDIEFAESHACLARTEAMRLPGVLTESLHNAQTLCCASVRLQREHGRRLVLDPGAVAAIVPIAFGYDLPWLCRSYMRRPLIEASYRELVALLGPGPSNDVDRALRWHAKHFQYLLGSMAEGDRLERSDLLDPAEVPDEIVGYDHDLPADVPERIARVVVPWVERRCPELLPLLRDWL